MTDPNGPAATVPGEAEAVLRFLESVGRKAESDFYVQLFRRAARERFAALSIDANVARTALDVVALHLKFLADLGLIPVVTLGLFEPTDAAEVAARLARRLGDQGVAAALPPDAHPAALGPWATALCRRGVIPIVPFGPAHGATLNARFDQLAALLAALQIPRLIFLHRPGGLRQRDVLVPQVNVGTDLPALLASRDLSRKERAIVTQSARLIGAMAHKLLVTVTSPLNLLRELFTVKGAGTLLRRGARVLRIDRYDDLDRDRLAALIASSFGRTRPPPSSSAPYAPSTSKSSTAAAPSSPTPPSAPTSPSLPPTPRPAAKASPATCGTPSATPTPPSPGVPAPPTPSTSGTPNSPTGS